MAEIKEHDLIRWAEALAAIAKTGLSFSENLYERERFEEVLKIAADIKVALATAKGQEELTKEELIQEWLKGVGKGVPGYVTPKVAVGAVVGNENKEVLLIKRADSGVWLYPTGWADVGYSPAEVVVKEVKEETGYDVEPVQLIGVLDGLRLGFTRVPLYSLLFHCKLIGGSLKPHPLEVTDVGWFKENELPYPLAGAKRWMEVAFKAINGEKISVIFDPPRNPVWRN